MPASATSPTQSEAPIPVAECVHGLGIGGAQQVIRYIALCGDRGFRYHVYTPEGGVLRGAIEAAGARVRVIPRRIPKFDPTWVIALARAMRQDGIRLVHAHLFGDSLHAYLAARLLGIPVVMTLHSVAGNFSSLQLSAYRWLARNVNRAIACSPSSQASFSAQFGERVHLEMVANGLSARAIPVAGEPALQSLRQSFGIPESALVIGAIGRLVEVKNYSSLVSALRLVRTNSVRDVRLILVGTGPLLDSLQRQAREDGVAEAVTFAGYRSDTSALLQLFDVLAFSSHHEGIPLSLLEGLALRRCVVATRVPSLTDVLSDDNAIMVRPRDAAALADGLRRALSDAELRHRLGAAGERRFLEAFTAEEMTRKYEAVYRQALGAVPGELRYKYGGAA